MKARILIVDDERNLRVTLAEILASRGYEILEAENSVDALASLERGVYVSRKLAYTFFS